MITIGEVRYLWERVNGVAGLLRLREISGCVGLTSYEGYASWSDPLPVVEQLPLSMEDHLAGSYATLGELGLTPNAFSEVVPGKVWSCCTPSEVSGTHRAKYCVSTLLLNYGTFSTMFWCHGGHVWDGSQVYNEDDSCGGHKTVFLGSWNSVTKKVERMVAFEWSAQDKQVGPAIVRVGALYS